ncbi:MAG: alpha-amylase family glycosyl hydrolase [Algoriphagus sp.]|uniref:alpha-amylase family glycosyl hydrolase n=1 Tax=Algoriphagus sp. TaxID=1872435 RepID=UPI00272EFC12|nr:alpha-amylase family glycosyl hydrolase [Algoriphagus sp.]MDP2041621.1 alpha-amylase family glycosyl hydrolase [Algoriphagus sp.]MDP3470783.1 alpha-amylase family glycosyl hydrolase [Algoriphagus sp.]
MNRTLLTTSILAFAVFSSCEKKVTPEVKNYWPEAGVTYEIFVQSFYDSNGDSIGDFNGVTQKLDYVKELGANAIWFMPIMPSPTYHKYDVTDYKAVHPDYGTMEDFKNLLDEAHKRDIKIVVDLIINHTGSDHPWFLEAKSGRDNPYRDYYVWAQKDTIADFLNKKTITLDSDNIRQWHDPGQGEDFYYGFFWGGMPDLNFDNPKVREEIYDIGRFWLEEIGVDGFRLDAAKHIFPDDRPLDNHEFWKEFRSKMEAIKPDVYLVGEVYDKKEVVAPYLPGLPALFNFDFHYTLLETMNTENGMLLAKKQKEVLDFYQAITPSFIDATFSSNHDQPRILNELGSDSKKYKQAISILLTMPGAPYLYYGEEIGMLGLKPDEHIREPFLWDQKAKDTGRAQWIKAKYSKDSTVTPLAQQRMDPNSYFNHYKELIRLRNSYPALAIGTLTLPESELQKTVMAYFRKSGDQEIFVVHNVGKEEVEIDLPAGFKAVIFSLGESEEKADKLKLSGNSSRVYLK